MSRYASQINTCLHKLQKGDKTQFDVLYDKTANHLRAVANKYAYSADDVDDILEDAYIRAYKSIATFDPRQDGYNWLCKIVQNVAYTYNEELIKNQTRQIPLDYAQPLAHDRLYDSVLTRVDLMRAMENEDETAKKILYLRFFENATEAEIAQAVELSTSGVHKKIQKILEKIEKFL